MIKYVNYGHPRYGTHMYVIVMNRTEYGNSNPIFRWHTA